MWQKAIKLAQSVSFEDSEHVVLAALKKIFGKMPPNNDQIL